MALTPNGIQVSLAANRASGIFPQLGVPFDQLALGIGIGVSSWAISQPQNLALSGMATGVAGAGSIVFATSKILIPPNVGAVYASLVGVGMAGPVATSLATTVALGISQAFLTYAQYFGPVAGVGNGLDVSKISVVNPATLIASLQAAFSGFLGVGPAMPQLATGLGLGLTNLLLLGTGQAPVAGVSAIPSVPAVTSTFSVVI